MGGYGPAHRLRSILTLLRSHLIRWFAMEADPLPNSRLPGAPRMQSQWSWAPDILSENSHPFTMAQMMGQQKNHAFRLVGIMYL